VVRLIRRRPFAELRHLQLRHPGFILSAFAVQAAVPGVADALRLPRGWVVAGWVAAMTALAVLALVENPKLGMSMIAVGIAANAVAIAFNGGMPVSRTAVAQVAAAEPEEWDLVHVPMGGDSVLSMLGDWIPIPGPPWHRGVVSPGDVVMALGVAAVVNASSHVRQR